MYFCCLHSVAQTNVPCICWKTKHIPFFYFLWLIVCGHYWVSCLGKQCSMLHILSDQWSPNMVLLHTLLKTLSVFKLWLSSGSHIHFTWQDESAGLVAAAFISIVPGYISRSVAGSYDNEGIAIFCMLFTYYLWIKSVKTGSIFWAALCSIAYFYMVNIT